MMTNTRQILLNLIKGNVEIFSVIALLMEDLSSRMSIVESSSSQDHILKSSSDIFKNLKLSILSLESSINYYEKIIKSNSSIEQ